MVILARLIVTVLMVSSTQASHAAAPAITAAGRLYVSDERGGVVVVVDAASGTIESRIEVGKRPRGLGFSPDGERLYVALSGSAIGGPNVDESRLPPPDRRADGIGVIDVRAGRLVATLASGPDPETFAVSLDGKTLYVANEDAARLSAVDVSTGTIRSSVGVGIEPEGVTLRPDGKVVYVACEGDNMVYALDAATLKLLGRIPTGARPRAITFTRDGRTGYTTDEIGATLTVFETATHAVTGSISLASPTKSPVLPMSAAVSFDGRSLYVTTGRGGSVVEVDIATGRIRRSIDSVGLRPWGLALSPDGRRAFTANGPSGDISIIDLERGSVERRIKVGESPWGVVYRK